MNVSRSAVILLIVLGFEIQAQVPERSSLKPSELKNYSYDKAFFAVLGGYVSGADPGGANWRFALTKILNESDLKRARELDLTSAIETFPFPLKNYPQAKSAYLAFEESYRKWRLESPKSEWFVNERMPDRIKALGDAVLDFSKCENPGDIEKLRSMQILADTQPLDPGLSMNVDRARNVAGFLPGDGEYKILEKSTGKMGVPNLFPELRSRDLAAPKGALKRWPVGHQIRNISVFQTGNLANQTLGALQEKHFAQGYPDVRFHFGIYPDGKIVRLRDIRFIGGKLENGIEVAFFGNFGIFDREKNPEGSLNPDGLSPSFEALNTLSRLALSLKLPDSPLALELRDQGLNIEYESIKLGRESENPNEIFHISFKSVLDILNSKIGNWTDADFWKLVASSTKPSTLGSSLPTDSK